ncbi:protease modulator HflK [Sphingomonas aerophila]|uniref:Membrane protease subunit HflK n=1 Tax=Sphingomonas aerophila TaxID=1344948 RepID=A0A7W9EV21_9SPHN|nr:protease modulator HflK [Sphingomonas aerophila]MBB5714262.1 membrane protease subunit HflK [Sphingomonas aerophila]
MTNLTGWLRRPFSLPSILRAEPKGPWGGGGTGGDDGAGPRNPWSVPPGGRKGPTTRPSALDEFLKRARGTGGGGGGNGSSGGGGLPSGNARALWGIGAGIIAVLWIALTSIHAIGPQQQGVVSYLGAYAGTLDPGIRLTLPAPIATVRKVDVQKIRTDDFPKDNGENLMLTGDRNIVDLAYAVRWDISSPQNFVFQLAEPQQTVRDAAESAMRAVLATTTFQQATGNGRTLVESRVADLTQEILNSYKSGVRVQGVSIKQASAPARIIEDFNAVTAAQQEASANIQAARSYASQVVARAQGEAAAFDKYYDQYKLSPEVTRRRLYYETMEAVLARSDKTVIAAPGVMPYLSLKGAQPLPLPPTETTVQPSAPPAPPAGGAQ